MAAAYADGPRASWALLSPEGTYHKLKEPSFFVGRNGDVDLTLKSRSVDKKHAVITSQEEKELHFIHDLDSLNGTFVNEKRIQKSKLGLGDTVRFGYDMNIYRIDLYPYEENKLAMFDENHNNNTCYKGYDDMYHHVEEPKKCHGCGSKTNDSFKESRPDAVIPGSNLYGQPSWWGWGSSDEEIYTYPNCATVVSQSGTTQCTILQQRIKRNKTNIEPHHTSFKKPTTIKATRTTTAPPMLTTRNVQEFSTIYNIPVFGAWESVPHGSYVEGLEEDSLDNDSYHSKDSLSFIPIVPDFGELPEKPVSEKSRKIHKTAQLDSSLSSSFSENSDFDYSHRRGVFGLTEVTSPVSNSPKGVRAGKPKHQPAVKIKSSDSKPATPRNEKPRAPLRRNSSASSATKESPSKPSHNRASSSGGSSIPSDNESRGSEQTPVTSTSDDSDGEHVAKTPNDDKDDKLKADKSKSLSPRQVYSDATDKGPRSSSLPRANKTALLRARNSREAIKTTGRRSSPLRSRVTTKPRHRRSNLSKESHSVDSSSSLRIWSPSNKNPNKSPSQESGLINAELSVSSSVSSSSVSDGTQAAVDAVFEAGTPALYVLPQDLQMNRNDSNNRTFVLEDKKDDHYTSSTSDIANTPVSSANNHKWISSMEDNLETLHLSFANDEKTNKLNDALQAERPLTRPPQPDDWVTSLSNKLRCGSPESLVSVPPASSPSPPSSPRSTARHLIQERLNCSSAPPHSRRQWDITEKPVEDLMLSSVHAFTVELRLASELVLSKARNLYETSYAKDTENLSDKGFSNTKKDSKIPEWKSSHAEIAGVFRNLRRVEFNLRTMDQALSYLCSSQDCQDGHKTSIPSRSGLTPKRWNEIQARARKFSWAEENRCKFPGPPSDDEEVAT